MNAKIVNMHRTGLLPEHDGIAPITYESVRLSDGARAALEKAGARIEPAKKPEGRKIPVWDITLTGEVTMPDLVVVMTNIPADDPRSPYSWHSTVSLRLPSEPEFPGEHPASVWDWAEWQPCPECGAPLVWYEAAYVGGYRVCARPPHHHSQVQFD